jgi:nucleotide-binding universal stress UspA family protein
MQATAALKVAVGLAAVHRGRITVLHVVAPLTSLSEIAWAESGDLRAALLKRLQADVAAATRRSAVRVRCEVVVGEPVRAILAAARSADAIVMSTLGQTGVARWLVGSVAEKVVRLSPVPVLTIRGGGKKTPLRRTRRRPRRGVAR